MAENYTILVCDDEKEITDAIEIYLTQEGYRVLKAYNGNEAIDLLNKEHVHLLIIDLMMPGMDGMTAVLKIRKTMQSSIPIIILSAKSQDTDKIMGLNYGADDYITKPFSPLELVARVNSQLRRYTTLGTITEPEEHSNVYRSGGLVIDDDKKEVTVSGESVRLTRIEYNILVTVHIRHIREKIEIDPKNPKYLKVMWGIGYKVEDLPPEDIPAAQAD